MTRINVATGSKQMTRSEDAGDGTVPLWSALPKSAQKQLVVGEHASFFTETTFKAVFFRLFGKNFPTPPVAVARAVTAALSVQSLTIHKKAEIELVIAPAKAMEKVASKVVIERSEGPGKPFKRFGTLKKVSYAGPPTPMMKLRLPATGKSGFYQLHLIGNPTGQKPVQFAVTDK